MVDDDDDDDDAPFVVVLLLFVVAVVVVVVRVGFGGTDRVVASMRVRSTVLLPLS